MFVLVPVQQQAPGRLDSVSKFANADVLSVTSSLSALDEEASGSPFSPTSLSPPTRFAYTCAYGRLACRMIGSQAGWCLNSSPSLVFVHCSTESYGFVTTCMHTTFLPVCHRLMTKRLLVLYSLMRL